MCLASPPPPHPPGLTRGRAGSEVAAHARGFSKGVEDLARLLAPRARCSQPRLRDALRRCGPVSGAVTAREAMKRVHDTIGPASGSADNAQLRALLASALRELDSPGADLSFAGWGAVASALANAAVLPAGPCPSQRPVCGSVTPRPWAGARGAGRGRGRACAARGGAAARRALLRGGGAPRVRRAPEQRPAAAPPRAGV